MRHLLLNFKFWFLGNIIKYLPILSGAIRSTTSIISIDNNNQTVIKETIRYINYNTVENELSWLNKLNDFNHTPKVISHNKNKLILSYAGEPLDTNNLPENWEIQIKEILDKLNEINCSHNDIKPTDLLVLNGTIMLIDFQWATKINEEILSNWPDCIGGKYKNGKKFDDQYSIYKSINSIIKRKQ